jgi:outer membrane protein assembly factor BamB
MKCGKNGSSIGGIVLISKRYSWIAPITITLSLMLSGCGSDSNSKESYVTGVYQGNAIGGVSDVAWKYGDKFLSPLLEPAVTDKAIYVGDIRYFYAIDVKTGQQLWAYDEIDGIQSRPAVANGVVSFIDNAGIHAFDAESGELLWERDYNQDVPNEIKPEVTVSSSLHTYLLTSSLKMAALP